VCRNIVERIRHHDSDPVGSNIVCDRPLDRVGSVPTEVTDTNQRAAAVVEDWMRKIIEHRSDLRFDGPS